MSDQPPVSEERPVEDGRSPWGWYVLGVLFLVMLVTSLSGSLSTKKPKKATSPYELLLKQETSFRSLSDTLAGLAPGTEQSEDLRTQAASSLTEPISDLVDKSTKDPEAARWYAEMRTEQGKPVPKAQIDTLRNSKEPTDQVLADIYAASKLTQAEAERLAAKIPGDDLVYKLARVHAMEKAGDHSLRRETFSWRGAVGMGLAGIIGAILFTGGGVVWAAYLRGRSMGRYAPKGLPLGEISAHDADRLAIRAAQILGAFLLLSIAVGLFVRGQASLIVQGILILLALPFFAGLPIDGKRISLESAGMNRENFWKNVRWGVVGFLAEFPLAIMMAMLGAVLFSFLPEPTHPATEQLLKAKNLGEILPILLFASITAPIWEEFVFRGMIFQGLSRLTGRIPLSAVITGFVFAMIHPQGIALWFSLASVGAMGCALTYQTRSLVPTIVMHMLHNSTVLVLGLLIAGKF